MAHPRLTTCLVGAGLLAGVALGAPASGTPATDGAAGPSQTLGQEVAAALVQANGAFARADATVGADGCHTGVTTPDPLVYRNDRIVLRSTKSDAQLTAIVNAALNSVNSPGTAGPIERITLPLPAPAAARPAPAPRTGAASLAAPGMVDLLDRSPVVSVTIRNAGDNNVKIVPLARRLRSLEAPIKASPDYLLSPSPTEGVWPNGFPEPTTVKEPPRAGLGGGATVYVYDTGIPSANANVAPNLSRLSGLDVEQLNVRAPAKKVADLYYSGHTLAIGGVIETLAPSTMVTSIRIAEPGGAITDVSATRRMSATLQGTTWPDVIVNAFGSPSCNGGPGATGTDLAPIGLEAMIGAVARAGDTVVVASAGNRDSVRRFYPAAFDTAAQRLDDAIISVGALDTTLATSGTPWSSVSRSGPVADFSNSGVWVEAFAPGVKLDTRHVVGLRFSLTEDFIGGRAFVDGTSFSAPYLAGLVAERIGRSPASDRLSGKEAWAAVAQAGRACTGSGGGIAVALRTMADTSTTVAAPHTAVEC